MRPSPSLVRRAAHAQHFGDGRFPALDPAQAVVAQWLDSFKDFPPRAKAASFTVSDAMDQIAAQTLGASADADRFRALTRVYADRLTRDLLRAAPSEQ